MTSAIGSRQSAVGSQASAFARATANSSALGKRSSVRRPLAGSSLVVVLALLAGCKTVGPDYARPAVTTPETYRGATAPASAPAIGEQPWETVFQDEALRPLIKEALTSNFDARIAATRVLQAAAQLGITSADQLPTITGQVSGQGQRGTLFGGTRVPTIGIAQVNVGLSWELDFWGRFRRATEAARAELAATQWGQRAIATRLVSEVAAQYYVLRALDLQREIATRTMASRRESLRLTEVREKGGVAPLVDVRQAEQLVLQAQSQISAVEGQIAQVEHALSFLLGRPPGPITRGQPLVAQSHPPEVPAGLPAALLERRADVQQAELRAMAATARIGVAEALKYPAIGLTGSGGVASTSLSNLLSSGTWSIGSSLVQPIFNAGRNRNRVALAEAQAQESALAWQAAVLAALRDVSDALVGYQRQREVRATQESLVVAATDARRLVELRYTGGASSYLEVLDSETRLFAAELALVQAQLDELTAFVEVYRALGGGWQS